MKFTVIPQDTFQAMQLNAGVLLKTFDPKNPAAPKDEDIICATTGGITIVATPTYTDMGADVDNCPNNMMELKTLEGWDCKISFTGLGTSPENIRMALGAAAAISAAGRKVNEDIYLLGVDALDECQEMVKKGTMTGTVLNDHIGQSHAAVDVAVKALNGEAMQNYYWVDYVKVDAAYFG